METLDSVKSDYELERGKPMPTWNHAVLQQRILLSIATRYAEQFCVLPELNLSVNREKLVPDLAIFAGADSFLDHDIQLTTEMPVVAVEIISPSQPVVELTTKAEQYLRAGVKSCWVVIPEFKQVVVSTQIGDYEAFGRHEILRDPVTGIELNLTSLFR